MKNKKIRRISIVMSLLLLLNNLGLFASDSVSQDELVDSSLAEVAESINSSPSSIQSRMGKYYSELNDIYYYDGNNELRYRTSSYGYAFRMFYAMNEFPESFGSYYEQQPGEFASKSTPIQIQLSSNDTRNMSSYSDVYDLLFELFTTHFREYSVSQKFNALLTLVQADAATLGYTLTEYTGTTIPDATTNTNRRMIAIVAGPQYYHFYMQHADNTWSHKNGYNVPQNTCLDDEHVGALYNSNIREHACHGNYYEGGIVKFYYITKNAIIDYKHMDGTAENSVRTRTITIDLAGSTIYSAKDIVSLPEDYLLGSFDYPGDIDYYAIYGGNSTEETISVSVPIGRSVLLSVYDGSGNLLNSKFGVTSVTLTEYFEIDTQYYISVYSPEFTSYENNFTYTLE